MRISIDQHSFAKLLCIQKMTAGRSETDSATCYSPLTGVSERKLEQFRLITLLPDQFSNRIRCQLAIHPLHDPPAYETISYAWGDPNDTKTIDVDGVELRVPNSLELCLRQLRTQLRHPEYSPVRALWTDSICIDQANLEERAVQVANMGTIYRRCSLMHIWLGPTTSMFGDQSPFEMILHWSSGKHFFDLPGFSRADATDEWVYKDNSTYQEMYNLFADGISRPWWSRLWCIQEVALCPRAIVRIGGWCIPWSTFLQAMDNYHRHNWGCCKGISNSMPARYTYLADPMLFLSRSETMGTDEIIRSLRHKLCKDPRDKIYGLLALLGRSASSLGIQLDYSITVGDLYRQVTHYIISQSKGDLRYLTGSGLGSDCYQLASWVRNFAAPLQPIRASNENTRYKEYDLYHASGETKSENKILDENSLCQSGIRIDHIDRIGSVIEYQDWDHPQGVIPGVQAWAEMAGISTLASDCATGSANEQFWRTLAADVLVDEEKSYSRIPNSARSALSSWFTAVKHSVSQGKEPPITPYIFAFRTSMSGRAFFRTKEGHMGMCYPNARPGDEVWVLAGGKVPFLLRPFDDTVDTTETPARIRKLIGDCYLDGFMDGEALQREKAVLVPVHIR